MRTTGEDLEAADGSAATGVSAADVGHARVVDDPRRSDRCPLTSRAPGDRKPSKNGAAEAAVETDPDSGKRELLDLLLAEEGIGLDGEEAICPCPSRDGLPLSFAQELLWLLDQLMPGSTAYTVRWATRIAGPLNVPALQKALDAVVARHEVLRTTYPSAGGRPVQAIAPAASVRLPVVDLRGAPDGAEAEVRRILQEAAQRPFNLACDTLGGTLLRTGEEEHVLFLTLHHIMCDGWSRGIFFRELASLYAAFAAERPSPLPPLPIQYADFAQWQRQRLAGGLEDRLLSYWKRQLAGAPALLELPADRPRPPVRGSAGARRTSRLPRALADRLRALSQQEGATLFMTLLAAFKALLHRYSGQEDVVLGSPIANRNRVETEPLIGLFANVLVLRTTLSGDPTFRQLLGRVREVCLGAYEHQDLPFEKLVVELQPERSLSYTPLFQVMFILQNMPREQRELAGLELTALEAASETTKFDLTLSITERPDGLHAVLAYNTDLFDDDTIARMIGHYQTLLEGAAADPDLPLRRLPLLTEAERRQLLFDWNATTAPRPRGKCVHHLFEEQASRTPDARAVAYGGQTLTYRELNARANRLARHLARRGVGRGALVGVCLERSPDALVAILGVLKAGGAYVALDPTYPQDRLGFMTADSQATVVLTHRALRDRLATTTAELIFLDDWPTIANEAPGDFAGGAATDGPAYVVYTSGSTGKPKGVVVSHAGLLNSYLGWEEAYDLRHPGACHLQMAGMSFDVFSGDWVRALCSGGKLVICPMDVFLNPEQLYELMARERVTCAEFVPAVLRGLMDYLAKSGRRLDFMRLLIAGSDTWYVREYREFKRLCGLGTRVINSYGVAEATIDSTFFEGSVAARPDEGVVPIGRPFANAEVYVLDPALQPVPVGVPGELYLGGVGLALGYLNRPELTAQKFIPHPFRAEPGARLYKTGDLARYRADGNLEFLGRGDHQLKIRGLRIEAGEIEAALAQHPEVREALVVAREDTPGDRRLVAYVVPANGQAVSAADLRGFLQGKLPEYMVPSFFVPLEAVPLSPNGKVDRRALPPPPREDRAGADGLLTPRDVVEAQLALIWQEVLGVQNVGVRDNFFAAGGHSMLAARFIFRIGQVFGQTLPLVALFQAPTIEGLAGLLRQGAGSRPWPTLVPVQARGSMRPLFCVARPNANPLGYAFLASRLGPEQPVYVLQRQARDLDVSPYAVPYSQEEYASMAAEYIEALRAVQPQGPYFLMGQCHGAHIAFEMARQFAERGEQVPVIVMLDAWPLENTRSYFLFHLAGHLRGLRAFLRRSLAEKLTIFRGKARQLLARALGRLLPRRRQPERVLDPRKAWAQRVWPGKDYVPTTVPSRIVVCRVKKQFFWRPADTQLGWGNRTTGGVEAHLVPGDHRTMLREPHVGKMAEVLTACLARAEGR
jgi:amino acid adenylation domain-containing protein